LVGGYQNVLAGGYVLFREEWVAYIGIEGTGLVGLIGCAVGLAGVLEDGDELLGSNIHDFVHGGWNGKEVNGKHGPDFWLRLSGCRWWRC
jgi:hypothetical protein